MMMRQQLRNPETSAKSTLSSLEKSFSFRISMILEAMIWMKIYDFNAMIRIKKNVIPCAMAVDEPKTVSKSKTKHNSCNGFRFNHRCSPDRIN
jgi:hypothetical protein